MFPVTVQFKSREEAIDFQKAVESLRGHTETIDPMDNGTVTKTVTCPECDVDIEVDVDVTDSDKEVSVDFDDVLDENQSCALQRVYDAITPRLTAPAGASRIVKARAA